MLKKFPTLYTGIILGCFATCYWVKKKYIYIAFTRIEILINSYIIYKVPISFGYPMEVESIAEKNLDQLITDIIISMNLKGIKNSL